MSRSLLSPVLLLAVGFAAAGFAQTNVLPANPSPQASATQYAQQAALYPVENSAPASRSAASGTPADSTPVCGITHIGRCILDLGEDDKGIFTSPLRMQPKDAYWLAPLGAATGLAIAYDADAANAVGINPKGNTAANRVADFGSFYATGAEAAGIYFLGIAKKDPKLAETGRLGAEAVIDSGTVTLVTKLASNRQRPRQGDGKGEFWRDGLNHWEWDSSFPSDHATASMSLARVIAGEYPRWYVVAPAYGFAEAVGISRILASQHFPSDVLIGQTIGFLTGSYLLNHRARYRPGGKKSLAARMIGSVDPIADARTRTLGATVAIPFGR